MKLKYVKLENYRNIEFAEAEFCDGINIITGNNAQGKTNMLEAVYLFARGRAFRAKKEAEIIKFGEKTAYAEIKYENEEKEETLTARFVRNEGKKFTLNGYEIPKLSELIGNFRAVLFSPDSLSLVKASPAERRLFADVAISQLNPLYVKYLKKYNALLSQRNALLRSGYQESEMYEVLAEQISPYAYEISKLRSEYTQNVKKYVCEYFTEMSGEKEKAGLKYISTLADFDYTDKDRGKALFYKAFTENIQRELLYKTTLYGPGRDDIELTLNSKPAKLYCSQGQIRSLALSLKLAEGKTAYEKGGIMPVYMLDDVFGELDEQRRSFLSKELSYAQVIITCCDKLHGQGFEGAKIFEMKDGQIS